MSGVTVVGHEMKVAAVTPAIRTHPETGRKCIYANRAFTTRIKDMRNSESDALLGFLFEHCQRPEYAIRWRQNNLVFWDNRCVQHNAMWDYWPQERRGHRVTIQGDAPY